MAETRTIHRTTGPKEINLTDFYKLSNTSRNTHIDALKQIPFNQLSQVDLGVVFFYYQNWLLEDWPSYKTNFISINEKIPQQKDASICVDASTSILEQLDKLIEEIPNYTKEYLKNYINLIFEDYSNWEWDLKATKVDKFIDATDNLYSYTNYEKEIIREYSRR